ncbi:MAG: type II toxin-antitoxin system prevent-host-death family antitoxin [Propionibacteriaceae bacterium]|jgi:prevent-host-death family protein|nr:type II toxin-antitoxin system prevent-host-death family antitoxin [Propionibacteriaceae bacterium]
MAVIDLGVRELQRETSQVIQNVENKGVSYRVTVQGRPTSVVVSRRRARESGATMEALQESAIYRGKTPELVAAQLGQLEASRDAAGYVGEPR